MASTGPSTSQDPKGATDQRSISELLAQLTEQSTRLAQREVELAKAEMTVKGKRIGQGAGAFGGAGLLAVLALGALTAAAILALATAVEDWLAAVIVAVVYLLVAGVLALAGKAKVKAGSPPVPEQATASVKKDVEQTKAKFKEGRA